MYEAIMGFVSNYWQIISMVSILVLSFTIRIKIGEDWNKPRG